MAYTEIDAVIVYELSQLTRSNADGLVLRDELKVACVAPAYCPPRC